MFYLRSDFQRECVGIRREVKESYSDLGGGCEGMGVRGIYWKQKNLSS